MTTVLSQPGTSVSPVGPPPTADRIRCAWGDSTPEYVSYHDEEWGTPLHGDDALFERLSLEAFQSGLSWITILRKRPAFRAAFAGFSIDAVAAFTTEDEARLMADAGIVRNRAKIAAAVTNARAAQRVEEGLSDLLWSFAPTAPRSRPATPADVPATTPESTARCSLPQRSSTAWRSGRRPRSSSCRTATTPSADG